MLIEVEHWSGAGNRFVIVDNRQNSNEIIDWIGLVTSLCRRTNMPDAEGLLVLLELNVKQSMCKYDFYNPDGSTGLMCGNGARCAIRHAVRIGDFDLTQTNEIQLILSGDLYMGRVLENDRIALHFPSMRDLRLIDSWTYVNVGSHHVVIDTRDLVRSMNEFNSFDLTDFALKNLNFYRDKVGIQTLNLNLAYPCDENSCIQLRTFENGVDAETQACGTGALSTAIAFWTRKFIHSTNIQIIPKSQRSLSVQLEVDNNAGKITGMILEGDARQDTSPTYFDTVSMEYQ